MDLRPTPALLTRSLRLLLAGATFFTQVLCAHAAEGNLWTERRRRAGAVRAAELPVLARADASPSGALRVLNSLPAPLPGALSTGAAALAPKAGPLAAWAAALPLSAADVRRVVPAAGKPSKIVVIVQDVHANEEAQRNIGAVLAALSRRSPGPLLVGLEGAFAPLDLSPFRGFPDQGVVRDVADAFLGWGWISGSLHAAVRGELTADLVGVDDAAGHPANVDAYVRSRPSAPRVREALAARRASLEADKARAFNPALREFDEKVRAYREGSGALGDYVLALASSLPESAATPAAGAFLAALRREETLDFEEVSRERARLLEALAAKASRESLESLAATAAAYRAGEMRHGDFYRSLGDFCAAHGVSLDRFPAVDAYVRYALAADAVDPAALFSELPRLEAAAYGRLARTPEERSLIAASRRLHLTARLADFSLTPEEWAEYSEMGDRDQAAFLPLPPRVGEGWGEGGIEGKLMRGGETVSSSSSTLTRPPATLSHPKGGEGDTGVDLSAFEDFYRQAHLRDAAMARNLLRAMDQRQASSAVLVAGGFHTDGVAALLAAAGAACLVVAPKLSKADPAAGSEYLSAFAREKTPLEKLFTGQKLFLSRLQTTSELLALFGATLLALRRARDPAYPPERDAMEGRPFLPTGVTVGAVAATEGGETVSLPRADGSAVDVFVPIRNGALSVPPVEIPRPPDLSRRARAWAVSHAQVLQAALVFSGMATIALVLFAPSLGLTAVSHLLKAHSWSLLTPFAMGVVWKLPSGMRFSLFVEKEDVVGKAGWNISEEESQPEQDDEGEKEVSPEGRNGAGAALSRKIVELEREEAGRANRPLGFGAPKGAKEADLWKKQKEEWSGLGEWSEGEARKLAETAKEKFAEDPEALAAALALIARWDAAGRSPDAMYWDLHIKAEIETAEGSLLKLEEEQMMTFAHRVGDYGSARCILRVPVSGLRWTRFLGGDRDYDVTVEPGTLCRVVKTLPLGTWTASPGAATKFNEVFADAVGQVIHLFRGRDAGVPSDAKRIATELNFALLKAEFSEVPVIAGSLDELSAYFGPPSAIPGREEENEGEEEAPGSQAGGEMMFAGDVKPGVVPEDPGKLSRVVTEPVPMGLGSRQLWPGLLLAALAAWPAGRPLPVREAGNFPGFDFRRIIDEGLNLRAGRAMTFGLTYTAGAWILRKLGVARPSHRDVEMRVSPWLELPGTLLFLYGPFALPGSGWAWSLAGIALYVALHDNRNPFTLKIDWMGRVLPRLAGAAAMAGASWFARDSKLAVAAAQFLIHWGHNWLFPGAALTAGKKQNPVPTEVRERVKEHLKALHGGGDVPATSSALIALGERTDVRFVNGRFILGGWKGWPVRGNRSRPGLQPEAVSFRAVDPEDLSLGVYARVRLSSDGRAFYDIYSFDPTYKDQLAAASLGAAPVNERAALQRLRHREKTRREEISGIRLEAGHLLPWVEEDADEVETALRNFHDDFSPERETGLVVREGLTVPLEVLFVGSPMKYVWFCPLSHVESMIRILGLTPEEPPPGESGVFPKPDPSGGRRSGGISWSLWRLWNSIVRFDRVSWERWQEEAAVRESLMVAAFALLQWVLFPGPWDVLWQRAGRLYLLAHAVDVALAAISESPGRGALLRERGINFAAAFGVYEIAFNLLGGLSSPFLAIPVLIAVHKAVNWALDRLRGLGGPRRAAATASSDGPSVVERVSWKPVAEALWFFRPFHWYSSRHPYWKERGIHPFRFLFSAAGAGTMVAGSWYVVVRTLVDPATGGLLALWMDPSRAFASALLHGLAAFVWLHALYAALDAAVEKVRGAPGAPLVARAPTEPPPPETGDAARLRIWDQEFGDWKEGNATSGLAWRIEDFLSVAIPGLSMSRAREFLYDPKGLGALLGRFSEEDDKGRRARHAIQDADRRLTALSRWDLAHRRVSGRLRLMVLGEDVRPDGTGGVRLPPGAPLVLGLPSRFYGFQRTVIAVPLEAVWRTRFVSRVDEGPDALTVPEAVTARVEEVYSPQQWPDEDREERTAFHHMALSLAEAAWKIMAKRGVADEGSPSEDLEAEFEKAQGTAEDLPRFPVLHTSFMDLFTVVKGSREARATEEMVHRRVRVARFAFEESFFGRLMLELGRWPEDVPLPLSVDARTGERRVDWAAVANGWKKTVAPAFSGSYDPAHTWRAVTLSAAAAGLSFAAFFALRGGLSGVVRFTGIDGTWSFAALALAALSVLWAFHYGDDIAVGEELSTRVENALILQPEGPLKHGMFARGAEVLAEELRKMGWTGPLEVEIEDLGTAYARAGLSRLRVARWVAWMAAIRTEEDFLALDEGARLALGKNYPLFQPLRRRFMDAILRRHELVRLKMNRAHPERAESPFFRRLQTARVVLSRPARQLRRGMPRELGLMWAAAAASLLSYAGLVLLAPQGDLAGVIADEARRFATLVLGLDGARAALATEVLSLRVWVVESFWQWALGVGLTTGTFLLPISVTASMLAGLGEPFRRLRRFLPAVLAGTVLAAAVSVQEPWKGPGSALEPVTGTITVRPPGEAWGGNSKEGGFRETLIRHFTVSAALLSPRLGYFMESLRRSELRRSLPLARMAPSVMAGKPVSDWEAEARRAVTVGGKADEADVERLLAYVTLRHFRWDYSQAYAVGRLRLRGISFPRAVGLVEGGLARTESGNESMASVLDVRGDGGEGVPPAPGGPASPESLARTASVAAGRMAVSNGDEVFGEWGPLLDSLGGPRPGVRALAEAAPSISRAWKDEPFLAPPSFPSLGRALKGLHGLFLRGGSASVEVFRDEARAALDLGRTPVAVELVTGETLKDVPALLEAYGGEGGGPVLLLAADEKVERSLAPLARPGRVGVQRAGPDTWIPARSEGEAPRLLPRGLHERTTVFLASLKMGEAAVNLVLPEGTLFDFKGLPKGSPLEDAVVTILEILEGTAVRLTREEFGFGVKAAQLLAGQA